ncbi:MAG: tetratricopeptide repeat protein, partial [Bacteroidota bacterium]
MNELGSPAVKKVLILPFDVQGENADVMDSRAVLEELTDRLTRYPEVEVGSKSTSLFLAQNPLPAARLLSEYAFEFLIEGGIKAGPDGTAISLRLLSTRKDATLLQLKHKVNEADIMASLGQMVQQVYFKLLDNDGAESVVPEAPATKAEEFYIQGLYHWNRYTHDELKLAIGYFKKAIQQNKFYDKAYAALADCYCVIGVMGYAEPASAFQQAKSYVQQAFTLSNKRAELFTAAALVNMFLDRDYAQAKANLSQALLLNDTSAKAHHTFAMYYLHTLDLEAAERHAQFNIKRAPLDIPYYDMLCRIYLYKREFKRGLHLIRKAQTLDQESFELKELEGHLYMHIGQIEKAIECYQRCLRADPEKAVYYSNLAYVFAKSTYHHDGREIEAKLEKLRNTDASLSNYHYARSMIKLGQLDYKGFFKHINLALDKGLGLFISELRCNPVYNEVRKDQRFKLLLERLSLNQIENPVSKKKLPASSLTLHTQTRESLTLDPQHLAYMESHRNYTRVYWFEQDILQ